MLYPFLLCKFSNNIPVTKGELEILYRMLFETQFTDINSNGVEGLFEKQTALKIITLIETINHNAEAA